MQVFLNKISTTTENTTFNLEYLNKKMLIKELVRVAADPTNFVLAQASPLPEIDEKTPAGELTTLNEYLEGRGIVLNKSQKHQLANILSKRYEKEFQKKPRIITRPDKLGKWQIKSNAFEDFELPVIEAAIQDLFTKEMD